MSWGTRAGRPEKAAASGDAGEGRAAGEGRSAKDEALRWLEYRERTAAEVERHLAEKGYPEGERRECMAFLADCRFVDDAGYCRRYIEYAVERGRGPLRIRRELLGKGVSQELADAGLAELYGGQAQREAAMRQAEKCLGCSGGFAGRDGADEDGGAARFSEKELARVARRLFGQGFGQSVVYDVLGRLRE